MADSPAPIRMIGELVDLISRSPFKSEGTFVMCLAPAVPLGFSSKGGWVMSSSQAVHEALSIAYLTQEGLVSLLTTWQKLTARDWIARCGPARRPVWEGPRSNPGPYPDFVRPLSCVGGEGLRSRPPLQRRRTRRRPADSQSQQQLCQPRAGRRKRLP